MPPCLSGQTWLRRRPRGPERHAVPLHSCASPGPATHPWQAPSGAARGPPPSLGHIRCLLMRRSARALPLCLPVSIRRDRSARDPVTGCPDSATARPGTGRPLCDPDRFARARWSRLVRHDVAMTRTTGSVSFSTLIRTTTATAASSWVNVVSSATPALRLVTASCTSAIVGELHSVCNLIAAANDPVIHWIRRVRRRNPNRKVCSNLH